MLRPSYYQDAGNPLQRHLLPRYTLPFEFPILGETAQAYAAARDGVLVILASMDMMHCVMALLFAPVWIPQIPLIISFLFAVFSGYGWGKAAGVFFRVILAAILAVLLIILSGGSLPLSMFFLAILLSLYLYKFGQHWIYRCTPSPLPRRRAAAIRRQLQRPLWILCTTPFLAAAAAVLFNNVLMFFGTLLLLSVIQFCFVSDRRHAFRYAKAALTSWCAYHLSNKSLPGVLRSPVGSAESRRVFLVTSALSFSCLYAYAAFDTPQRSLAMLILPALLFALAPLGILISLIIAAIGFRHSISRTNHWSDLADECRDSTNPVVRDSYFMGHVAADGTPLLIHKTTFDQHCHFVGTSGGGKTSKGLCPWMEQTIRHGQSSLIVLDLKADSLELLATLAASAEELQRRTGQQLPLKVFSSMANLPTYAFNPMAQRCWNKLELNQKTDVICAALGLNYGTDYGAGYYSSANSAIVYEALRLFPTIRNFTELAERCRHLIQPTTKSELHPEIKKDGVHVCEELKKLAAFEQLQVAASEAETNPVADQAIDLASMFLEPQLLYVHLSSTLGASSAPTIARLFTYFLLVSAAGIERRCKVYLVIDEFQRMASQSLDYLFQLARSLDIGIILANQSMEDLKSLKSNLIPTIEANCQYRQWFDVGSTEDLERILKMTGETVEQFSSLSVTQNGDGATRTDSLGEQILPRLSINEIMTAGSDERLSIVRIGRDGGYAQYGRFPFIVRSDFHISKEEYQRRRGFSWPELTEGMMIPKSSAAPQETRPSGPTIVREVDGATQDGSGPLPQSLNDLFDAIDDESKTRRKKKSDDKPRDADDKQGDATGDDNETTD